MGSGASAKGKWIWTITSVAAAITVFEICFCVLLFLALAVMAAEIIVWPLLVALAVGVPLSSTAFWWATRQPILLAARKVNALLVALQSVIALLFLYVFVYPLVVAVEETMIIPDTYMGYVEILYGVAGAMPLERSPRGVVIYRIPENGIFSTSDQDATGHHYYRVRYFYQKKDGSLERIAALWPTTIHETDPDFLAPTVGVYRRTGSGNVILEDGRCRLGIKSFFVGTKKYIRAIEGRPRDKPSTTGLSCERAVR